MQFRIELNLGPVYASSVTPLIGAVEDAAMNALAPKDAEGVAASLESAALRIRRAVHTGKIGRKAASVEPSSRTEESP